MSYHYANPTSSIPRNTLCEVQRNSVDMVLKDLKSCSRRLNSVVGAFSDEYKLLERLYYKGKNQHRGSLFWRRVVEIRRFCDCLDRMQINNVVEAWRCSFFGEDARNNPKQTRGPWTNLPSVLRTKHSKAKISACSALIKKMDMRLLDAYRSFTLAMQSGAFLQLLLTLTAIVSRFGAICSELREVCEATLTAMQRISSFSSPQVVRSTPQTDLSALSGAGTCTSEDPSIKVVDPSLADEVILAYNECEEPALVSRVVLERVPIKSFHTDNVRPQSEAERPKKKQKKQRAKDEIDEIFGI